MAVKKLKNFKEKNEIELKREKQENITSTTLRPSSNAAAVMLEYGKMFGEQDINDLTVQLIVSMEGLKTNDLSRCENMLLAQAHALQSMFVNLSRRAAIQEQMKHIEGFLRMALKAQNQCRMTLETLATIKNPPVVYAKQANIAHGHQQVNNAAPPSTHAEKNQTSPNELLEADTHEQQRLDTRAPGKAGGIDQAMATVGKRHRRKNG